MSRTWLIYALGGGLGHLTRALSLSRAAARRGHRTTILTNSPFAPLVCAGPGTTLHLLPPSAPREALLPLVQRALLLGGFDVLVVDTFPRGLGGELPSLLPSLPQPKVLVHRDLAPAYVQKAGLVGFVGRYDLLLVPGTEEDPPLCRHPAARITAPWLVCDADELLERSVAREALFATGEGPLLIVSGCGRQEEVEEMAGLARSLHEAVPWACVRFVAPLGSGPSIWPLLRFLPGVDLLVGAGGYNTVQEARATATPMLAFARTRLYDRQQRRLRPGEQVADTGGAIRRVREVLCQASSARPAGIAYQNGAHEAVLMIEALKAV